VGAAEVPSAAVSPPIAYRNRFAAVGLLKIEKRESKTTEQVEEVKGEYPTTSAWLRRAVTSEVCAVFATRLPEAAKELTISFQERIALFYLFTIRAIHREVARKGTVRVDDAKLTEN
jgi:hypothetical protein